MLADEITQQLIETRRHFLQTVMKFTLIIASVLVVSATIALFTLPNPLIRIYASGVTLLWIGNALSFWMIQKRPLAQAILPVTIAILLILVLSSLAVPYIIPTAFALLALIVLIISITGHRRLTLTMTIIAIFVASIMLSRSQSLTPVAFTTISKVFASVGMGAILLIIWLIADRYTHTHEAFTSLAAQRATEAEMARVEAEEARAEAEQRFVDQKRLLELVQSLELPIISIGQGVLAAPLVGSLDTERIAAIQKRLLDNVASQRARIVILDVTGITMMDAQVAQALLQTAQAVRLLGAKTIMSGIGANSAQILAGLDVELTDIQTVSDMGQALEYARANPS